MCDTPQTGTLVGAPQMCLLGLILTYYDGSQPLHSHLKASMLAYAHIKLFSMHSRFASDEAVRVAIDSIYVRKSMLKKLHGVEAFVAKKECSCVWCVWGGVMCVPCLLGEEYLPSVAPAQWCNKGEELRMPQEHAAYLSKHDYKATKKDLTFSTVPRHDDPLLRPA